MNEVEIKENGEKGMSSPGKGDFLQTFGRDQVSVCGFLLWKRCFPK